MNTNNVKDENFKFYVIFGAISFAIILVIAIVLFGGKSEKTENKDNNETTTTTFAVVTDYPTVNYYGVNVSGSIGFKGSLVDNNVVFVNENDENVKLQVSVLNIGALNVFFDEFKTLSDKFIEYGINDADIKKVEVYGKKAVKVSYKENGLLYNLYFVRYNHDIDLVIQTVRGSTVEDSTMNGYASFIVESLKVDSNNFDLPIIENYQFQKMQ